MDGDRCPPTSDAVPAHPEWLLYFAAVLRVTMAGWSRIVVRVVDAERLVVSPSGVKHLAIPWLNSS
jgi:hypothetical protein